MFQFLRRHHSFGNQQQRNRLWFRNTPAAPICTERSTTTFPLRQASTDTQRGQPLASVTMSSPSHPRQPPLQDVRQQLWEFYLSTGRGANALFQAIDWQETGTIDPAVLQEFMVQVLTQPSSSKSDSGDSSDSDTANNHPSEVMPYAWHILEQRKLQNKRYDVRAFKQFLVAATKMSADMKNSRLMEYLQQRKEEYYFTDIDEDDEQEPIQYTWNEESMSQTLRRMQYAVRGEVVLRADALAARGRKILYTNIGNPHQVGQSPITYYRQVMALCNLPAKDGIEYVTICG